MPEAPDFDENRKSTVLTCRSKVVAFSVVTTELERSSVVVTEYQCDSFRAVESLRGGRAVCVYARVVCVFSTQIRSLQS